MTPHDRPRLGETVIINDENLENVRGVIRAVYKTLAVSVALDEADLTPEQIESFVRHPVTMRIHYVVEIDSYEIFGRRVM